MRNQYCADATNLLKVIFGLQRQRRGEKFLEHRTVEPCDTESLDFSRAA
jgi:hypothetical protein